MRRISAIFAFRKRQADGAVPLPPPKKPDCLPQGSPAGLFEIPPVPSVKMFST